MTGDPCAVLADAHPVARLAMRHALGRVRVRVVDEAADAAGAVRAVRARRPSICLLDAQLPGGGIVAADRITSAVPETRVVVLFESCADEQLIAALHAGAAGCLLRDIQPEALGRAVRATLAGEAPLPRAATARVIAALRARSQARRVRTVAGTWTQLSVRESQVLELMQRELTTGEIATRLGISAVTVRRHLSGTLRRLGAPNRDAALRLVAQREREGV
ncbi:MAG TPA: response regulator transcription factor [Conexibacter sp.]|nr:response regulator transcription factor [Conexibacter sp.]